MFTQGGFEVVSRKVGFNVPFIPNFMDPVKQQVSIRGTGAFKNNFQVEFRPDLARHGCWGALFSEELRNKGDSHNYELSGWAGGRGEMLWCLVASIYKPPASTPGEFFNVERATEASCAFKVDFEGAEFKVIISDEDSHGTGGGMEIPPAGGLLDIEIHRSSKHSDEQYQNFIAHTVSYLQRKLPELTEMANLAWQVESSNEAHRNTQRQTSN